MRKLLLLLIVLTMMTSCTSTRYYQIYKTTSDNSANVFEDSNCRIEYNFWSEGGNAGFSFYNKTNEPITINLNRSYFVLNGNAFDYFQSRVFTQSSTESMSVVKTYNWWSMQQTMVGGNSGSSVARAEAPTVTIPANTTKYFSEYSITNSFYTECGLEKYPASNKVRSVTFDKDSSPFVFYNSIVYTSKGQETKVTHNFYVSELTNVPEKTAFRQEKVDVCGRKIAVRTSKYASSNSFYHTYFQAK